MIDRQFVQRANEADLLALIGTATRLKRVSASAGGEYAGPCPLCGGRDRFHVQPARGRWLCRRCTGKWSDAIALHRALYHSAFEEAVRALCAGDLACTKAGNAHQPLDRAVAATAEPGEPPPPAWQNRARDVITEAQHQLWANNRTALSRPDPEPSRPGPARQDTALRGPGAPTGPSGQRRPSGIIRNRHTS